MIATVTHEEKMQDGSTGQTVELPTGQVVKVEESETINKNMKGQKMEKETAIKRNLVKLSGSTAPKTESIPGPLDKTLPPQSDNLVCADRPKSLASSENLPAEVQKVIGAPITKEECELQDLELEIRSYLGNLIKVGMLLKKIADKELYKLKGYRTISDYCDKEWDFTYRRFKQLTDGYDILVNVNRTSSSPVKITHEGQTRQLARIPEHKQAEVWDEIVKDIPEGEVPTAKVIKTVVDWRLGATSKKKVNLRTFGSIAEEAGIGTEPAKYFMFHVGSFMEMMTWNTDNKSEKLAKIVEDNDKAVQSMVTEYLKASAGGAK
jgi:hypothetical protein